MNNENEDKFHRRLNQIIDDQFKPSSESKDKKEQCKSQADKLVELVSNENAILFHDQFKEPYAHILIKDHRETHKIKSKQFKRWLCGTFWENENKASNANAVAAALNILESKACFQGKCISLENRVTFFEGAIWYDLSNEKWQAVKITAEGWEIVDNPPILFRRYTHQAPQVLPIRSSGNLRDFLSFVNLAKLEQGLLLLVYLVSCFIPEIAHPIPILYGPQGAAKTTLARMLRALIDPSSVGVLSMPNVSNDLIQLLSHHWFAFFDNVTYMPEWASDSLCRSVTGEGFSKRELYSDDEDVIYHFRRCNGLNGINLAAKKPDLLDRGILFKLEHISKERRKSERIIWKEFEAIRPIMLGAIFAAISKAMELQPTIQLKELPRMADFAIWGSAVSEALGHTQAEFLQIYYSNIEEQHDEAIQENPVATAIIIFMEGKEDWEGSPSELFQELDEIGDNEKLNAKGSGWPKSASALSRKINEVKTNLAEKNILIESEKIANGRRLIKIQKKTSNSASELIEAAKEIFGGEIIEDQNETPQLAPRHSSHSESQKPSQGESGDISSLPF